MSGMTPHGPQVEDSEDAYRAILYPGHWAADQNRPSSAAFDDAVFSVDLKSRTTPQETASRFRMTLNLVEFNCGVARTLGFDTRDERDEMFPENRAHAHVYYLQEKGRRKQQARKLAKTCKIVDF